MEQWGQYLGVEILYTYIYIFFIIIVKGFFLCFFHSLHFFWDSGLVVMMIFLLHWKKWFIFLLFCIYLDTSWRLGDFYIWYQQLFIHIFLTQCFLKERKWSGLKEILLDQIPIMEECFPLPTVLGPRGCCHIQTYTLRIQLLKNYIFLLHYITKYIHIWRNTDITLLYIYSFS